jgi:Holliday junction resolvase
MGGKMSRDKGARREREFVHRLIEAGIPAERVPLSGAAGGSFGGDIRVGDGFVAECKARKNGSGFATLEGWLDGNDFLFLQRDRADPFVCMTWKRFVELMLNAEKTADPYRYMDESLGSSAPPPG